MRDYLVECSDYEMVNPEKYQHFLSKIDEIEKVIDEMWGGKE